METMVDPIPLMCHQDIYDAGLRSFCGCVTSRDSIGLLDLGCGNARYLAPCLKRLPPAIYEGVDLSEAVLAEA